MILYYTPVVLYEDKYKNNMNISSMQFSLDPVYMSSDPTWVPNFDVEISLFLNDTHTHKPTGVMCI